jgi:hypothetical protein
VRISFFTALRYAWSNRREIASHNGYAAYLNECAAKPAAAYWAQNNARAGAFPDGPDGGWRYKFERLPMHDKLLKAYGLRAIAGQGSAFARALRLMDWFCAHTCYNGMEIRACYRFQGKREDGLRILRYAYDGGFRRAINCEHKAYAFADCLVAAEIYAIPIAMNSFTYRPGEADVTPRPSHFVVHAWLPEEQRWVVLDPSLNSYIADEAGRALNLVEIQALHRQGAGLRVARYDFNGTQDCRDGYLEGFVLGSLLEITAEDGTRRSGSLRNILLPEGLPHTSEKRRAITVAELLAEPAQEGDGS